MITLRRGSGWVRPTYRRGAVKWCVSAALAKAGLRDTWREAHPDPVAVPGFSWTPGGPETGKQGVRPDRSARAGVARGRRSASRGRTPPGMGLDWISVFACPKDNCRPDTDYLVHTYTGSSPAETRGRALLVPSGRHGRRRASKADDSRPKIGIYAILASQVAYRRRGEGEDWSSTIHLDSANIMITRIFPAVRGVPG
jgi:hypothetical protein